MIERGAVANIFLNRQQKVNSSNGEIGRRDGSHLDN